MPEFLLAQNSQTIQITGKVTDTSGEPVIGGSVFRKGTSEGVFTDLEGNFKLSVPQGSAIVVRYLGYVSQELVVADEKPLTIILQEDVKKINEVVVIGYGTRQRKSIVGAVDQIGSNRLEDRPVGNTMQALQGAAANLIIQQRSMNPNDNSMNINIRGINTMNNNDPLVIIDGIITEMESLNRINPDDIAGISVLKDAGSAAIYGSRSSNGVILVTTKQGTKGLRPVIRFNSMVGYENPKVLFRPVKGYENALLRNQAEINSGNMPSYTPGQIRDLYEHRDEEEWFMDQIMQRALQQSYNVSISGGNEQSTYLVSGGFFDQGSNFAGDDYGVKRYNFRTNLSSEYGKFKLTTQIAYNRIVQNAPNAGNAIIDATRVAPYYYNRMKAANGRYLTVEGMEGNSLGILEKGGFQKKDEDNIIGNVGGELTIIPGLKAKGMLGIDLTAHHRLIRGMEVPYYSSEDATEVSSRTGVDRNTEDYNEKKYTLNTQFMLDYDRTFNEVHQVSGLLGVSNESFTREANEIKQKFTDPELGIPAADGKTEFDPGSYNTPQSSTRRSIYSLFGRAAYSYADTYYGEASFRYDGSSKFAESHRWGFFPSFSAGWRLSQEAFMDFYRDEVGDFKIRGSYGVLGNQNVDDYSYVTTYTVYTNNYGFNNTPVSGTGFAFGNSELQWEKSANFNIGFDATFLKDQLTVSFDYFNKKTTGILLKTEVPMIFGGEVANENAGEMQNRGWELTLNYHLKTGALQHVFNFNIADSQNKVTKFGDERISDREQMASLIREGVALHSYFGYKTDGYFNNYEEIANGVVPVGAIVAPGDVKYVNYYPDDVIDDKDRQILGNAFPRYTFGFNYNVNWNGFDLDVFFQGVGKRNMVVRGELIEPFHANYSKVIYEHQLDFWSPTNTDARWPRLTAPGNANNYGHDSELFLLDAAYLRLKNIQIGYTLPKSLTTRFGVQKLRVSLNAQNLWTLTKNSFIDPESTEFGNNMGGVGGVDSNSARNYPTLKYYGIGLNLEF
ncbi:MAG: TonB-dependent receptor [Dysgonamonadaceae bacterium]|jgi:TonB-linked SusC/RagA family outer membrane protein|nr:TonB-dependent receptor [Dysgonamonadaceae bacterium]